MCACACACVCVPPAFSYSVVRMPSLARAVRLLSLACAAHKLDMLAAPPRHGCLPAIDPTAAALPGTASQLGTQCQTLSECAHVDVAQPLEANANGGGEGELAVGGCYHKDAHFASLDSADDAAASRANHANLHTLSR